MSTGVSPLQWYSPEAGGNISPKRFCTLVAGVPNRVVQASAVTQILVGVSADWTRYTPGSPADDGYHAVAGEAVTLYGPFQRCLLALGATAVTDATIPLTTDANGKGVPAAPAAGTVRYYGALPLRLAAAGADIPVIVLPVFLTN